MIGVPTRLRFTRKVTVLDESVPNLRFEFRGERRAAVVELVTVMLHKINS